jgi:hypothetical protein
MTKSHTPTPWELKPEEMDKQYIRIRGTKLGGRYKIANVLTPVYDGSPAYEADETRANAAFIVRACNSHDPLIKALQEACTDEETRLESISLDPARYTSETIPYFKERVKRWRELIAKAGV